MTTEVYNSDTDPDYIPANFVFGLVDSASDTPWLAIDKTNLDTNDLNLALDVFKEDHKTNNKPFKNTYRAIYIEASFEQTQLDRIEGGNCPYCNGQDYEGGPVEIDGLEAYQQVTCNRCYGSWNEGYKYAWAEPRS